MSRNWKPFEIYANVQDITKISLVDWNQFFLQNGLTPLHLCAQENRVAVAELLHKNGADIEKETKGGFTPLHIASHYGQADMVKFLLSKGANVKATTSLGYTPLHQAAQQGQTNIVNILLENSAQPNAVTNVSSPKNFRMIFTE